MSAWKQKRFWKTATPVAVEGGFTVTLDGRSVKTPAKTLVVVPSMALAELIAAEWDAQQGVVRPETMPTTRMANSALDKVAPQHAAVADMLADYAGSDLLCYRAPGPQALIDRQARAWDPLLDWAALRFGARLTTASGVMHVAQDPAALASLRLAIHRQTIFQLAALHDLIAITGSAVLGLAIAERHVTADEAFQISRIDEHWQAEQWGRDDEAEAIETGKRIALIEAARFHGLCP
ncbi:ATP12 family chaperone protein [Gemmobacter denitrificans]|uniref:ATP12 family protein n=1 Tax=Gemmobacter denitrificans TaxID=3123040 RepID=A0ABU8BXE8_9RHOB